MPAELFVVLAAGLVVIQMASVVLRRAVADERPYLFLLAANLAALGFIHATGRAESAPAIIAEVVAGILTLTPRFLERREAVAVEDGRLEAARFWSIVKNVVVPGRGSALRRR